MIWIVSAIVVFVAIMAYRVGFVVGVTEAEKRLTKAVIEISAKLSKTDEPPTT